MSEQPTERERKKRWGFFILLFIYSNSVLFISIWRHRLQKHTQNNHPVYQWLALICVFFGVFMWILSLNFWHESIKMMITNNRSRKFNCRSWLLCVTWMWTLCEMSSPLEKMKKNLMCYKDRYFILTCHIIFVFCSFWWCHFWCSCSH